MAVDLLLVVGEEGLLQVEVGDHLMGVEEGVLLQAVVGGPQKVVVEDLLEVEVEDLLGVVVGVLKQAELVIERRGEETRVGGDGSLRIIFLTRKNIS